MNEKQIKAVNDTSKSILLIAGAGTGKTTVLIAKIKKVIEEISPEKVLAITFTKKAKEEMILRLKNNLVNIHTFDSLCHSIVGSDKRVLNDEHHFSQKQINQFNLYDINFKNGKKPKHYDLYLKYKNDHNYLDFNDLEYKYLEYIKKVNQTYEYIFIDEFQDTNELQFEIIKHLVNNKTYIFAVGDPDQSIYKFRGSKPDIIKSYINYFNPNILELDINYRSYKAIIEASNKLISYNKSRIKKTLIASHWEIGVFGYYKFNSRKEELSFLLEYLKNNNKTTILTRTHERAYDLKQHLIINHLRIKILTIHESKGLEFDEVIILGVDLYVFPKLVEFKFDSLEEERRLMFVAMTRARKKLIITTIKPTNFIYESGAKRLN